MKKVSLIEFQQSLTTETIRTFQVIQGAIMAGVSFFLLVVIYLYITGPPSDDINPRELETLTTFSFVHGIAFVISLLLSKMLYNWSFSEKRVKSMTSMAADGSSAPVIESYIGIIRTAMIIRTAVLEACVFFGLVVCFMGVTAHIMQHYQYYWLNTLSYIVFMYIMIKEFPSKDSLVEIFKTKLKDVVLY